MRFLSFARGRRSPARAFASLLLLLALLAACGDPAADAHGPADPREGPGSGSASDSGPPSVPAVDSFPKVQALFAQPPYSCGPFGCHGSGRFDVSSRFWVAFDSDHQPVDHLREWAVGEQAEACQAPGQRAMKRVDPGSPETSFLWHVLRGTELCGGVRMPAGGPYLSDAELALVERWIRELAP